MSGLKNADVDAALVRGLEAPLAVDRLDAFKHAEDLVMAQLPIVPIAAFPVDSVQRPYVRGVAVLPTGNFDAAKVWLSASTTTSTR